MLVLSPAAEQDGAFWRARVQALEAENAALRADKAELCERVEWLAGQVGRLQETVTTLSGLLFGASSEKKTGSGGGQGNDAGEGGRSGPAGRRGQRPGVRGHGRRDYSQLQTEERFIDVEPGERVCGRCGAAFEPIGTEDSEQVDWRVEVTRIVWRRRRYKRACDCDGPKTICARPADKPVPKGRFTAGFLARLLYEKYVLGLPAHRIARALAAGGLDVAEGTLTGALKQVAPLLRPLAAAIAARGAAAGHVHADETGWQIFAEVPDKGGHQHWLWVFVTAETVTFVMDPTRSAKVAAEHLGIDQDKGELEADRRLVISSDFHRSCQALAKVDGVDPLWCWSHIRRYFLRAGAAHPGELGSWRDRWIERIGVLYMAHHAVSQAQPGATDYERALARYQRAFDDIDAHRVIQARYAEQNLMHPAAAKVIATLNNEWDGLARHRDLPQLPLDNNTAERALRTPVVGRKNFYGSHMPWAADLAADVWTITATAGKHDIEALAFLTDYLQACARAGGVAPAGTGLDSFLPWTPQGRQRRRLTAAENDHRHGPGP